MVVMVPVVLMVMSAASPLARADAPMVRAVVVAPATPPPAPMDWRRRPSLPKPVVVISALRSTVMAPASRLMLEIEPRVAELEGSGA